MTNSQAGDQANLPETTLLLYLIPNLNELLNEEQKRIIKEINAGRNPKKHLDKRWLGQGDKINALEERINSSINRILKLRKTQGIGDNTINTIRILLYFKNGHEALMIKENFVVDYVIKAKLTGESIKKALEEICDPHSITNNDIFGMFITNISPRHSFVLQKLESLLTEGAEENEKENPYLKFVVDKDYSMELLGDIKKLWHSNQSNEISIRRGYVSIKDPRLMVKGEPPKNLNYYRNLIFAYTLLKEMNYKHLQNPCFYSIIEEIKKNSKVLLKEENFLLSLDTNHIPYTTRENKINGLFPNKSFYVTKSGNIKSSNESSGKPSNTHMRIVLRP